MRSIIGRRQGSAARCGAGTIVTAPVANGWFTVYDHRTYRAGHGAAVVFGDTGRQVAVGPEGTPDESRNNDGSTLALPRLVNVV